MTDAEEGKRDHLSPRLDPHRLNDEAYCRLGAPVFFTLSTAARRPFLTDPPAPYIIAHALDWNTGTRGTCLICYCIMPDHLHFIACNGREGEDIREYVRGVKLTTGRLFREAAVQPPFWERSYWDHHAGACQDLNEQVGYVLQNPVRAGLCRRVEDWPYSGWRGFRGSNDQNGNDTG